MRSLALKSYAKLNLYLKLKRKRPDGFHEISTLFERIDLADDIVFKRSDSGRVVITCDHPDVPTDHRNLVYQAAELLRTLSGCPYGAHITINKRIPVAAGMAGGSSNCAAALQGLNKIWDLKLPRKKLIDAANQLGSDIAFFLYDTGYALGTGRGEKIEPLKIPVKLYHVIVTPRLKLYTAKIYQGSKLQLTRKKENVNILIHHLRKKSIFDLSGLMTNDLEPEAIRQAPVLKRLKERLNSLKLQGVMVSGSGPTVFGLAADQAQARQAFLKLSSRYKQVFTAQTL